jgi:hypothetical protein
MLVLPIPKFHPRCRKLARIFLRGKRLMGGERQIPCQGLLPSARGGQEGGQSGMSKDGVLFRDNYNFNHPHTNHPQTPPWKGGEYWAASCKIGFPAYRQAGRLRGNDKLDVK